MSGSVIPGHYRWNKMTKMKCFGLDEIITYLSKEKPDKAEKIRFQREGFRCLGAGERGMGGLSRTAKFIPESIHILLAPLSCMRHCDFDLKLNGYTRDVYSLFLSEKEIVSGRVADVLWECIRELLKTLRPQPKVITITVTCIDGLIHSDYTAIRKKLMDQYGIRFGVVEMFPILADNKVKHTDLFPEMVYSLIRTDVQKPKKKLINLLGHVEIVDSDTDFYRILQKAGYEVREIRQCKNLDEFDEMGEACLNIVLSEFHLYAAKMMEKKYHIPYFFWNESMNPETIRQNYEVLEGMLHCKLETDVFYQMAKEKAEEVKRLSEGKTFAIGQRLDYVPVKAACELTAIGLNVKYVFVDQIQKADLEYYAWLQKHSPQTCIYLAPDISMRQFMNQPEPVDVLINGSMMFMKNVKNLITLELPEEPYDFQTFLRAMEIFEEQMLKKQIQENLQDAVNRETDPEESIYARAWRPYPEEV